MVTKHIDRCTVGETGGCLVCTFQRAVSGAIDEMIDYDRRAGVEENYEQL